MLDATLLSKVYLKLTTGKQENLNLLNNNSINPNGDQIIKNLKLNFDVPREKLMDVSSYEKKEHESFITGMTNPLWKKIK